MNKTAMTSAILALTLTACASSPLPPPSWNSISPEKEVAEYAPYLISGTGSLTGQAFLTQKGGGVVPAAGQPVTLDPVTSTSIEWWQKAGTQFKVRDFTPPSGSFQKARKTVIADGSGKFTFGNLPAGKYFVRTILTWDVPYWGTQGGILGDIVEVKADQASTVILNHYAPEYPDQQANAQSK